MDCNIVELRTMKVNAAPVSELILPPRSIGTFKKTHAWFQKT